MVKPSDDSCICRRIGMFVKMVVEYGFLELSLEIVLNGEKMDTNQLDGITMVIMS